MSDPPLAGWRLAAGRLGISVAEYAAHREAGDLWCTGHKAWEPAEAFSPSQRGGRGRYCRVLVAQYALARYVAVRAAAGKPPRRPRVATHPCPHCGGTGRVPVGPPDA